MKSYRDLEIFKESKRLAIEVHRLSLELPKFELYEEGSQVRRSSKAVAANIVEGYGRKRYKLDYIKYLIYAQAECDETLIHLEFLFETGSCKELNKIEPLKNDYTELSKKINKFIQWVDVNFVVKPSSRDLPNEKASNQQPATVPQAPTTDELNDYTL